MGARRVNRFPEPPGQRDISQRERSRRPNGGSETPPPGALPRSRPRPVCVSASPGCALLAMPRAISDLRTAATDPAVCAVQAPRPCAPRPKRGLIVSSFVLPTPEGSSSSSTPPRRCSASAAGMSACSPADRAKGPYRKRSPSRLRALVVPQSGDLEVLRALAPAPLVRLRPQRS